MTRLRDDQTGGEGRGVRIPMGIGAGFCGYPCGYPCGYICGYFCGYQCGCFCGYQCGYFATRQQRRGAATMRRRRGGDDRATTMRRRRCDLQPPGALTVVAAPQPHRPHCSSSPEPKGWVRIAPLGDDEAQRRRGAATTRRRCGDDDATTNTRCCYRAAPRRETTTRRRRGGDDEVSPALQPPGVLTVAARPRCPSLAAVPRPHCSPSLLTQEDG